MCGIVGAVSKRNITPILIHGLNRLEYRGYDSAGVAVLDDANNIQRVRSVGKIKNLEVALNEAPANGFIGIGHHRKWDLYLDLMIGFTKVLSRMYHEKMNRSKLLYTGKLILYQQL